MLWQLATFLLSLLEFWSWQQKTGKTETPPGDAELSCFPELHKNKALKFKLYCKNKGQKIQIFLGKAGPGWSFHFKGISVWFVHFAIIFTGVMGVVKITGRKMIWVKYFLSQWRHLKSWVFSPIKPSLDSTVVQNKKKRKKKSLKIHIKFNCGVSIEITFSIKIAETFWHWFRARGSQHLPFRLKDGNKSLIPTQKLRDEIWQGKKNLSLIWDN